MNRFIALNLNLANTPFGLKYGEYYSLPVILYDTEQFKKYLSQYPWCFFTNADNESLKVIIEKIDSNYTYLNKEASGAINANLNFDSYFTQIILN